MANQPPDEDDQDDDGFSRRSDYVPRDDGESGREGPPDDWESDSWRDFERVQWWYRWPETTRHRLDPPPILILGHRDGNYYFVTRARELRVFTSGQLHGRGGLADLFAGDVRWATRHYPARNREGDLTSRPNVPPLMEALIAACRVKGYYDGRQPFRSIGTWLEDGKPLVHAGNRIFHDGRFFEPGEQIGRSRYVLGPNQAAPAHQEDRDGYEWTPLDLAGRAAIMAHLDEWHWDSPEARELAAGKLWCDALGDAVRWKVHGFFRARAGSGKSTLLQYIKALLGGAAHEIERSYSKTHLEEQGKHKALAILLEEAEGDPGEEASRLAQIFKLLLLLSDEGATGGRFNRQIDLHGPVTLVATLTDNWKATIKSRVVLLELRSLRSRENHALLSPEGVAANIEAARGLSTRFRAAVLAAFDLFHDNLKLARARILDLGGDSRDADTLGHLLAGLATMTLGRLMTEDEVGKLDRFVPWITTLRDQEDGVDDAMELFNTILGLPADNWRGGGRLTIGQMVALGREDDGGDYRKMLLVYGLRLDRRKLADGTWETWEQAWLVIANRHPGLDDLLRDYPQYQGLKRSQILEELKINGQPAVQKTESPMRFAGPQSRGWMIDPRLLPSVEDDRQ